MSWQDAVIAVLQFSFALALLPTLLGSDKPAPVTSAWTAFALTVVGACFLTMGLYLSTAGIWAPAMGWWVLVWQGRRPRTSEIARLRLALEAEYVRLSPSDENPHRYVEGEHADDCAACAMRRRLAAVLHGGTVSL